MTAAFAEVALAESTRNSTEVRPVVQAFVGQNGYAVVTMYDSNGKETDNYDKVSGIAYESDAPTVCSVVDEDAVPKDAELKALAVGTATITCSFDGDPGDGVRRIILQSELIDVAEPPPGEAVSGSFSVSFKPV